MISLANIEFVTSRTLRTRELLISYLILVVTWLIIEIIMGLGLLDHIPQSNPIAV
jgi:hypothetical protein